MKLRTLLLLILAGVLGFWLIRAMLPAGPGELERVDPYAAGRAYFADGDYERALQTYRRALEQRPRDPRAAEASFHVARSLERLDRPDEAANAYRDFIDANPAHPLADRAVRRLEALSEPAGQTDQPRPDD